ncbi:MAG: prepilin peptidase [Firmicutes bacterium]|nr:prepilin peptidase [Bacillota bacterium]
MSEWIFTVIVMAVAGLAVGSFLNVCIFRIPAEKSIVTPPSHCPACGTRLKTVDLVPVLSYIILKGRCRYCNLPVSPRYALVESLTAVLFILVLYRFGIGLALLKYLFAVSLFIIIAFIDIDHFIIPNQLVLAGLIAGAVFLSVTGELRALDALYGIISSSGFLLVLYIASRGGMGLGDIKLAAVIGIFLGWPLSLLAVVLACCLAGITGSFLIITGRKKRKDRIPFGPFLVAGAFAGFMWGWDLVALYINIL